MKRVTIIGLGLIGGSLGLALKSAPAEYRITGHSRSTDTVEQALKRGAIDIAARTLEGSVAEADIAVVATPVLAVRGVFGAMAPALPAGCIVTDTASTKAQVTRWASQLLPPSVTFIGGHPMAGKETSGIDAADAALFRGCTYCLTGLLQAPAQAGRALKDLVAKAGARPLEIEAGEHDRLAAGISHLPFLLAVALAHATSTDPDWDLMSRLASSGYRDMTRLAAGDADMMKSIIATNQDNIQAWLDRLIDELNRMKTRLSDEDRLDDLLRRAKEARLKWYKAKYGA